MLRARHDALRCYLSRKHLVCFDVKESLMQHIARLSLGVFALAVAVAAAVPSGAMARTPHKGSHAAPREKPAEIQGYRYGSRPNGAYDAIPGGSSSYPGYGYGYGDNSHGCSACN